MGLFPTPPPPPPSPPSLPGTGTNPDPGEGDRRHRKATGKQKSADIDPDEPPSPPDNPPPHLKLCVPPNHGHLPSLSPPNHAGYGHSPRDGDTAYLQPWGAAGGLPRPLSLAWPPNYPVGCWAGCPGCGQATAGALRRASESVTAGHGCASVRVGEPISQPQHRGCAARRTDNRWWGAG